jgi:hypothetical protein
MSHTVAQFLMSLGYGEHAPKSALCCFACPRLHPYGLVTGMRLGYKPPALYLSCLLGRLAVAAFSACRASVSDGISCSCIYVHVFISACTERSSRKPRQSKQHSRK